VRVLSDFTVDCISNSVRPGGHPAPVTTEPLTTTNCLACGGPLAPPLERSGSLRCHDCRDSGAPIRPELLAAEAALSGGASTWRDALRGYFARVRSGHVRGLTPAMSGTDGSNVPKE